MEVLPFFLTLVKSNSLIYAFLLTGNIDTAAQSYMGECINVSEHSIILLDFKLDPLETFDYIQITKHPDFRKVLFVAKSNEYFDNSERYFGEKTIYYNIIDKIREKNLVLKNEKRYCYPFLSQKASISLPDKHLISLGVGAEICNNY